MKRFKVVTHEFTYIYEIDVDSGIVLLIATFYKGEPTPDYQSIVFKEVTTT